ncbi:MAG: hypothetical protein V4714_02520 [Bacteroidota bacterium]
MRSLFILWFVCLVGLPGQAQTFKQEVWYDGTVLLDTEDSLKGSIRFDLNDNLLELRTFESVKAYSARKIISFSIYDAIHETTRHFYTLPYSATSAYKVPFFFELLTQGDITLLCREKLETVSVPNYNAGPYGMGYGMGRPAYNTTRTRIVFDYFFGYPTGNIKRFMGNKKDFFYLVKDHQEDIKGFVKEGRLDFDNREDLIKIITYYNYLKGK